VTEIGEWQSQVRRGLLELCILALLERGPSYGYDIVSRLGTAAPLAAGEGTVYPLLRRLRQVGWLDTYWQESTAGPPRQYYRLSAAGSSYLAALKEEWRDLAATVAAFVEEGRAPR
jgi:PadR family transcriptional regulator PadR